MIFHTALFVPPHKGAPLQSASGLRGGGMEVIMTDLSCKATKCGYNKEEKCSKGEIRVGGEQAKECMETRCEDFDSKRKQSCESCATPKNQIEIACEATKCQYNEKDHCTAKHVDIQGIDANMSRETDCSTFKAAKAS